MAVERATWVRRPGLCDSYSLLACFPHEGVCSMRAGTGCSFHYWTFSIYHHQNRLDPHILKCLPWARHCSICWRWHSERNEHNPCFDGVHSLVGRSMWLSALMDNIGECVKHSAAKSGTEALPAKWALEQSQGWALWISGDRELRQRKKQETLGCLVCSQNSNNNKHTHTKWIRLRS